MLLFPFRRERKTKKPDDRLRTKFTAGNSRSAQSPAVNLTPAARFLVFLTYAPKSVKPHVPHFQKAHPTGGILLLSPLIQSAVSPTIPYKTNVKGRFGGKATGDSGDEHSQGNSVFVLSVRIRNCVKEKSAGRGWGGAGGP